MQTNDDKMEIERDDPIVMRPDQTHWLPNYVAEWEAREHQFRGVLAKQKLQLDDRYQKLLSAMSDSVTKALEERDKANTKLERLYAIPLVGRLIIWYTERDNG